LAAVAATPLYTVPSGKSCIVTEVWLEAGADVGAALVFTIGRSTALADFSAGTIVTTGVINGDNLDAANDIILIKPLPSATPLKIKVYPAGTIIKIDVTTGGNAVAGTVYLFGFLK